MRIMLGGGALDTVRLPPVHELTAADLPLLRRWLRAASILVSQPVRAGYRGLAIGTAEVIAAAGPGTRVAIVPVVRFAGLYPEQVIVRPPHDPAAVPPVVPYHSLATLARAAGRRLPALTPAAVHAVAAASRAELARRERAHGAIAVSDLLRAPSFAQMRTINHPGNPIWQALAARIGDRLGLELAGADPGRPLLDAIHAPRRAAVLEAFGLPGEPDGDWRVAGRRIPDAEVTAAHLGWYARHPETVAAGLERHRATSALLGLR